MKKFNIKNTLIALACTLVFAQANAMEIDPNQFTLLNLPDHELLEVLIHLENKDIASTARTCSHLAGVVRNQATQNLMHIKKIKSDIDQLIPDIIAPRAEQIPLQAYINQLNTILKNLDRIDAVRTNPNNSIFAKKEREHLNQLLKHDYIEFYQSRNDINNDIMAIINVATIIDAHYAIHFHLDYIDEEVYTPFFNPTTMLAEAITHQSIKTLDVLLKNFPLYINQPIGEKTILDSAKEQLYYAQKRDEAERSNLQTIINMLRNNGAQTYAKLDATQKKKRRASTPPPAPRKKR